VKILAALLLLLITASLPGNAQTAQAPASPGLASVPSGSPTNQMLRLTLREAINMAVRYNLGVIESGQNIRIARGQRLRALSNLLPQFSASTFETVEQITASSFGIKSPLIPSVIPPFSYSTAQVTVSQTLFSFESIQRWRAARTTEQAASLTYEDMLDVVTLV